MLACRPCMLVCEFATTTCARACLLL